MKNECQTSYVFYTDIGNKNELLYLHNKLLGSLVDIARGVNPYSARWLGKVLIAHGFDCSHDDDNAHSSKHNFKALPDEVFELGKGIVHGKDVIEANSRENPQIANLIYFTLQTSTEQKPATELWEAVVSQYEGVSFVYFAESEGVGNDTGTFINSDRDNLFFSDRYSLRISCNEKALDRLAYVGSEDSGVLAIITNWNDQQQLSDGSNVCNSSNKGTSPNTHSTQEIQIREYLDTFEELRQYFIKLAKKDFGSVEQMQRHLSVIASYTNGVRNAYFMASVREYAYE